jgi:cell division protein YceG involved in septum cleavage
MSPSRGTTANEQFVDIPPGISSNDDRPASGRGGVISSDFVFRAALSWSRSVRNLKAGEYRFDRPMTRWRWLTSSRAASHLRAASPFPKD